MRRLYVEVLIAEVAVMAATFLAYRFTAYRFGAEELGAYVIVRRVIGLIQLPLCLGLAVSLPRFVAYARAESGSARAPGGYLRAALLLAGTLTLGAVATLWLLAGPAAHAAFGGTGHAALFRLTLLAMAGMVAHAVVVAYQRGRLALRTSSLLQVINLGVVPPAALALAPDLATAVTATGVAWLGVAAIALAFELRGVSPAGTLGAHAGDLLRYGLPRVPGEAALVALTALPPIFVAQHAGLAAAGRVGFSLSVLAAFAALGTPVGTVLLPTAAAWVARRDWAALARGTRLVVIEGLGVLVLATGVLALAAPQIGALVLGPVASPAATATLRLALLGAIPYGAYIVLRAILDAAETRPLNARNLVIALGVLVVAAWAVPSEQGVVLALVLALVVLGSLTAWTVRRVLRAGLA